MLPAICDEAEVLKDYEAKMKIKAIMAKHGISFARVYTILARAGVKPSRYVKKDVLPNRLVKGEEEVKCKCCGKMFVPYINDDYQKCTVLCKDCYTEG
jgi:hypothetical protein